MTIYNTGTRTVTGCPIHPPTIPADRLALRSRIVTATRAHWTREHTNHYMPQHGCPLCATNTPRTR